MVYVDDFMVILEESQGPAGSAMFLLFLSAVGCPVSWHKNALDAYNLWLGYEVDINSALAFIPPCKQLVILPILNKFIAGSSFSPDELASALGRLQ